MKSLYLSTILIVISLLVPFMLNNTANGCLLNPDWPNAPCYDIPGIHVTKEQMQKDWSGYYQYKGSQWMEMKKIEMVNATATGTLKDWVCNSGSNYDVWWYYYLNDLAPFIAFPENGPFCDNHVILDPLKQFRSGISASDVKCTDGITLVIKSEDGSPACVKPDTANILIKRGWASSIITKPSTVQQTSGNTTLPASFMPCDTPFPQSNTGIAVLYMPMNSIGKLCVRYSNFNDFPALFRGITITNADNLTHEATEISTWNDAGGNTTLPKGNFTTVYWIKTGNQSGFYGLTIFCVPHALAVGYDNNSRIVSGDFPWFGKQFECPMQTYDYHIDSTTGIGVKYIPYP